MSFIACILFAARGQNLCDSLRRPCSCCRSGHPSPVPEGFIHLSGQHMNASQHKSWWCPAYRVTGVFSVREWLHVSTNTCGLGGERSARTWAGSSNAALASLWRPSAALYAVFARRGLRVRLGSRRTRRPRGGRNGREGWYSIVEIQ